MGNWGISENATPKEKLKSEMADFLAGLNSCGEISYSSYSEIFDFSMELLDKMYELGKSYNSRILNIDKIQNSENKGEIKMFKIGDKVKIKPSKLDFYKKHTYSFVNLDEAGVVSQVMEETAVVRYGDLGYNIDKNDLYISE